MQFNSNNMKFNNKFVLLLLFISIFILVSALIFSIKYYNVKLINKDLLKNTGLDTLIKKDTVQCRAGYSIQDMISLFVTNDSPSKRTIINTFGKPDTTLNEILWDTCTSLVYICGNRFVAFHYKLKTNKTIGNSEGNYFNGEFFRRTAGMLW